MKPFNNYASLFGIATGLALLLEFTFFMASGFTPDKVADPMQALALVQHKITLLRIATFFGFSGAIVSIPFLTGLSTSLRTKAPGRATILLYFGIAGSIGHALVAFSYYLGFPGLVTLAANHLANAAGAWGAILTITNGFQGLGNVLLGLVLGLAGSGVIANGGRSKALGWVGIIAGVAAILGVITTATPFSMVGYMAYIPSIILAIVFDVWAGVRLRAESEITWYPRIPVND